MNTATIIIPTLNEADNIDILLNSLSTIQVPDCTLKILFVDDQSSDNTIAKIRLWQNKAENIHYLQRSATPDLTQSVIDGVKASNTDYVLVMDADLSHPVNSIPDLLAPLLSNEYDISIGSRYTKGGGIKSWPIRRRLLSWIGGLPARIITDVNDTTSGFFACRRECFEQISNQAKGYKVLIELLAANLDHYKRCEVPITFTDRIHGESKLSGKQITQYLTRLGELCGFQFVKQNPLFLFGAFITGMIADLAVFNWLNSTNTSLASAHLASYVVASIACLTISIFSQQTLQTASNIKSNFSLIEKLFFFILFSLVARCLVLSIFIYLFEFNDSTSLSIAAIVSTGILVGSAFFSPYTEKHFNSIASNSIRWRVISVATIAFAILIKVTYSFSTQLIPDEAYYWNYQEFLALSYLDHPPLIAWTTWLSTNLMGDNEFSVRIFPLLAGIAVLLFIYHTTLVLFDKTSAYIAVFISSLLPFTFLSSFFATTDALLMMFWAGCLYFIVIVVKRNNAWGWIGFGSCIGLGMLSKYTIGLLVLSVFLFVIINREQRKWLTKPVVYYSVAISILLFIPVIYWNYINEWSSFSFQTTRRIERQSSFSLHYLLFHIAIILGPVGVYLYANSLIALNRFKFNTLSNNHIIRTLKSYYYLFIFIPLAVFIYFSLSYYPRFHWTAPVWLTAIPFMAHSISPTFIPHMKRFYENIIVYSNISIGIIFLIILNFASLGVPFNKHTQLVDHYFWKEVAAEIHNIEQKILLTENKRPVIIGLSKWSVASSLRFYDVDKDRKNILSRNALGRTATMYEEWTDPKAWATHPVIFVAMDPNDLLSEHITQHSKGLKPPEIKNIYHNNVKLRELHLRFADEYDPSSLY